MTPQHKADEFSPAYWAKDDKVVSFLRSLILDIIILFFLA